jgi:hypothetical protein
MTRHPTRLILAIVLAAMVLGLLAYARGEDHHHGDDVGAQARSAQVRG